MRRTDRLRSVRELDPHAGLPAAARRRARETAGSQKRAGTNASPQYSRRIAGTRYRAPIGFASGGRGEDARVAYLHTDGQAIL